MKKIPLTGKYGIGKFALVDDEDYERITGMGVWHVVKWGYASMGKRINGAPKTLRMHLVIMGTKSILYDHINRNKLDNRKCNLRIADRTQSQLNRGNFLGKRYKGMTFRVKQRKWLMQFRYRGRLYLEWADSQKDAARRYNRTALAVVSKEDRPFLQLNKVR